MPELELPYCKSIKQYYHPRIHPTKTNYGTTHWRRKLRGRGGNGHGVRGNDSCMGRSNGGNGEKEDKEIMQGAGAVEREVKGERT